MVNPNILLLLTFLNVHTIPKDQCKFIAGTLADYAIEDSNNYPQCNIDETLLSIRNFKTKCEKYGKTR